MTSPHTGADAQGPSGTDVRARLSSETRPQHEALHVHPVMAAMLASGDSEAVRRVLSAFQRTFGAVHDAATRYGADPAILLDVEMGALASDLGGDWETQAGSPAGAGIPFRLHLPSLPHALGGLYVVLGSQFGRTGVASRLPGGNDWRYWTLPPDPVRWKALVASLEKGATSAAAVDRMIEGARSTFAALHLALAE